MAAKPVRGANIFEQGTGKLDLLAAFDHLTEHPPHVSAIPASLDLTACPYMWPYCAQELYHTAMPLLVNVTLLNSISVSSVILSPPTFTPSPPPPSPPTPPPSLLSIAFLYSQPLWPWSGYLALRISVTRDVPTRTVVEGTIALTIQSDDGSLSPLTLPLRVALIPRPPRALRVLWDQHHNLRYPSGYFPRDNLEVKTDTLDWNGDHPHTNYRELFTQLRSLGYFVEVLGANLLCFNASLYGVLMLVDSEEEWWPAEVTRLSDAVRTEGLGLIVVAEWYNVQVMREVKFWDENTASWWTPVTGGANVPALNDLLAPFGVAFSSHVVKGRVNVTHALVPFSSGTTIARFPAGGYLLHATLQDGGSGAPTRAYPVMGLWQGEEEGSGRVLVWGDSNCLDLNNNPHGFCTHLLHEMMAFVSPHTPPPLHPSPLAAHPSPLVRAAQLQRQAYADPALLPERMVGNNLAKYSKVISPSASPVCASAFDVSMPPPIPFTRRVNASDSPLFGRSPPLSSPSLSNPPAPPSLVGIKGGRHQYRTSVTSAVLLAVLVCGGLGVWLLWLFHWYGAVEGKRRGEEEGGEGREGVRERGGWGRLLWLWVARTAPSCCLTLLRLVHSTVTMAQPTTPAPPTPLSLARSSSTGQWRPEKGPEIITDSE